MGHMPIQLEFNLEQKDPIDHMMDMWAKSETSHQKRFRRLFAETGSMKRRLKTIEQYIELVEREKGQCTFYEFDLFNYKEA